MSPSPFFLWGLWQASNHGLCYFICGWWLCSAVWDWGEEVSPSNRGTAQVEVDVIGDGGVVKRILRAGRPPGAVRNCKVARTSQPLMFLPSFFFLIHSCHFC